MTPETITIGILSLTIFFFIYGIIRTTVGQQESAKQNIKSLLSEKQATNPVEFRKMQENILRRRKKDDTSMGAKIEMKLERANILLRLNEFFMICFVVSVITFLIGFMMLGLGPVGSFLIAIPSFWLPQLYLNLAIWQRMKKADAEFANILDALVNCFKTGYGFSRAVQVVAENYDDPWGTEFSKMAMEMNLGSNQEDVLLSMSNRVPLPDVDLFVTAMIIQKETGGNMAELLSTLSTTCRERFKLYRKVGAISAQGKLSATIICLIPPGLMLLMSLFIHDPVVRFVSNPIGQILLILVGIWMCIGVGVLFKIVNVEV